jgi:hypothetical protein
MSEEIIHAKMNEFFSHPFKNSKISVWESQKGNRFWTFLKMSKIEKGRMSLEKTLFTA